MEWENITRTKAFVGQHVEKTMCGCVREYEGKGRETRGLELDGKQTGDGGENDSEEKGMRKAAMAQLGGVGDVQMKCEHIEIGRYRCGHARKKQAR